MNDVISFFFIIIMNDVISFFFIIFYYFLFCWKDNNNHLLVYSYSRNWRIFVKEKTKKDDIINSNYNITIPDIVILYNNILFIIIIKNNKINFLQ